MKNIALLIFSVCMMVACKKDDPNPIDPTPDNFNFTDPTITLPKDAYGQLHHSILNFEIEIPGFTDSIGTAVLGKAKAYFFTNTTDTTFADAGCTVNIGPYTLNKQSNNSYLYLQDSNDSLIYRNNITWNVSCKSINKTAQPSSFPNKANITSEKNIYRLSGYTAKNTAFSGADSVIYQIQTTTTLRTKVIQKTMPGNATQCDFSYSELIGLDASNFAILIITGYKVSEDMYDSKKYYSTFQQSTAKLVVVY